MREDKIYSKVGYLFIQNNAIKILSLIRNYGKIFNLLFKREIEKKLV